MVKAHFVKSAKIDYPEAGITKGESYWWWQFKFGGKRVSKEEPRHSELTRSGFLHSLYVIKEKIEDLKIDDDLNEERNEIVVDLDILRDECNERLNNTPAFEESDAADLLRERSDCIQEMIDEFKSIDLAFDDETSEDEREAGLSAMKNVDYSGG